MKKLFVVLALFLAVGSLFAQEGGNQYSSFVVFNNKTYAAEGIDTSGALDISNFAAVTYAIEANDSMSAVVHFDYRPQGASSWTAVTAVSADTILSGTGSFTSAAKYRPAPITLRSQATDRIPQVGVQIRIRHAIATGAYGVSTPKYWGILRIRKN